MTLYEFARLAAAPFLPVLEGRSRSAIRRLVGQDREQTQLLDVGGRKSPYTIGVPAAVTIMDVPPQNAIQERLDLGVTGRTVTRLQRTRSNIQDVVIQDMTRCALPDASFDGVVSVEVIEHVPEDELFVSQIERVLKPGGWLYLTTPNGDYVKNVPPDYNPDHVRHYTRQQLEDLLSRHFERVVVAYGVKAGKHRYRGLRSPGWRHPIGALGAMIGNLINHFESRGLELQPRRTMHLIATARKKL
ncbi:MAG TPA: class I SAM-dependent methyltransferase [Armatimonadota bacterium]|nr:class I SAM-dependent methyltransferase [Armatimonadota bacterium]